MKSPGQAAFEKFNELFLGINIPWAQVLPDDRANWEAIAEAAIDQYEEDNPRMLSAHD